MNGEDIEQLAKMILDRLNNVFNLEEFLIDEKITDEEIISEIEEVLFEVL